MKKNRGITLIVLIITVIVLLILAGIGIGIVLNGGIIGRAKEAKFKTQMKALQEQTRTIHSISSNSEPRKLCRNTKKFKCWI
jgi:flagellar basal body-associated protein FliL